MVATTIPTPLVTSDIDGSTQIGAGVRLLTDVANVGLGMGRRLVAGSAGDSMEDNDFGGKANNTGSAVMAADSAIFHMLAEHYNADIDFDAVPYENGGHAVATGGTTTQNLLEVQADKVISRPPDLLFVSTLQNDNILDAASATASVGRAIEAMEKMLPYLPLGIVLRGALPKGIAAGPNRPEALTMANAMMRAWAARTPGVAYVDVLALLKDQTGTFEVAANPSVPFKEGFSGDQVHFLADGGRAAAGPMAAIVRGIVPERQLVEIAARDYSQAYPWGSYFGGRRALMMGTGSTINGTASNDVPAGWTINYPTDGGLALVPGIVVGADGYRRFVMSWTGTATKQVVLTMATSNNQPCEAGMFGAEMLADHTAVEGWGVNYSTPVCNIGDNTWTLSGVINGTRLFRSPRLVPFSNEFSTKTMTISAVVNSGVSPKGTIGVYRASMTRQGDVQ